MIKRISHLFTRFTRAEFVKVSFWSAISTFIKMVTGFVSVKVVAQIIGPPGVAMVGQFANSIALFSNLGSGCIGLGVTKYVAENYDNPEKQKLIIGNAVKIILTSTLVVSVAVFIFYKLISASIFKSDEYDSLIILLAATIGLYAFNSLLVAIINGFKTFKKLILVNIVTSIVALAISVILVVTMGLYGALLNCVVSQSVVVIVTLLFVYKEPWFKSIFTRTKTDWVVIRHFGGFALMTAVTVFLSPMSQITIRSYIANHISLNTAGLWEGMNRISAMYLMLITTSISVYYLPRLAELKEQKGLRHEILKTYKLVIPLLLILCLSIFLFRDIIIRILFSPEFIPMRELFAYQMIGDFFKIASFLLAYLFWAKAMTKHYIITEIIFFSTAAFLSITGVKLFGLQGSAIGYALNYFIYFITLLVIFRKLLFGK